MPLWVVTIILTVASKLIDYTFTRLETAHPVKKEKAKNTVLAVAHRMNQHIAERKEEW